MELAKPDGYYIGSDGETIKTILTNNLGSYQGVHRSISADNTYQNIETDTSVRVGFRDVDYYSFRPEEAVPSEIKKIIGECMKVYYDCGLIRNIIDLMGDFACQGITLVHPNKQIQQFYRNWFKKVSGKDRSERFLNLFYRAGQVPIYRSLAKISSREADKLYKSVSSEIEYPQDDTVRKNVIPIRYQFLNPLAIDVISNPIEILANHLRYGFKFSSLTSSQLKMQYNKGIPDNIMAQLPEFIKNVVVSNSGKSSNLLIPIPENNFEIFFYKKDDWQVWAIPFLYSILSDIKLYEKHKLADRAALDGAISQVRLWKLGNIQEKIFPGPAAAQKLGDILLNNTGGGPIDIIWDAAIEFQESTTNIHQYLGSEKYGPTLTAIYQGVGIPATLTGNSEKSGFTNNYISLKTLVERLNYGRDALYEFWEKEIKLVQKAMGFRLPASIQFEQMNLSDETSLRKLLIDLADRGYLSVETLQERFGEMPDIERIRSKQEDKERKAGRMPQKAGPWHNPEFTNRLKELALQQKLIVPEQLEELKDTLLPAPEGKKPLAEKMIDVAETKSKQQAQAKGVSGQGRPTGVKDKSKRKTKEVKPRSKASEYTAILTWARQAQNKIGEIINPLILDSYSKKNLRSLSHEEFETAENIKFALLLQLAPFSALTADSIINLFNEDLSINEDISSTYQSMIQDYRAKINQDLTIDDIRQIQTSVYSLYRTQEE